MITFKENPSQYFSLIGEAIQSELYKNFDTEFGSTFIKRINTNKLNSNQFDYDLLYKQDGLLLTILDDKVKTIKFYLSPNPICQVYKGEVVNNLSSIIDETKIMKMGNYSKVQNNDPNRLVNQYKLDNVSVEFDSMTGEMLVVEILS